jgi:hypothetical protein
MESWFNAFKVIWIVICLCDFITIVSRIFYEGVVTFFTDPAEVGDLLIVLLGFVVASLNIYLSNTDLPLLDKDAPPESQI